MKARKNEPVGSCPCPVDPAHRAAVHQFATRAKSDEARRKAGKFYLTCPEHGKLGLDASAWIQEHVLASITWAKDDPASQGAPASDRAAHGPDSQAKAAPAASVAPSLPPAGAIAPTPAPAPPPERPRPLPAVPAPAKPKPSNKPWWQF